MSELILGLHAVRGAVKREPDRIEALWVDKRRKDQRLGDILALARRHGVKVQSVSREELDKLADGARHQGVVARFAGTPAGSEDTLWDLLDSLDSSPLLLVLDGVTDPHNLGACLRTADAAGVNAVIAPRDRAAGLTPVVRKVASGAAESVPFVQVTNLARTLDAIKERGVWVVGADGDVDDSLYGADLSGPLAVVFGAEGQGLRRLTRERCDHLVAIPMAGQVESLNVSVACGVVLFEVRRQRNLQSRSA